MRWNFRDPGGNISLLAFRPRTDGQGSLTAPARFDPMDWS